MRPAMSDANSQRVVESSRTLCEPIRSAIFPPTKAPTSDASVPPTVAIEFANSRSSAGTSRGTTADAAASWNRLIDRIASAPMKKGTGSRSGSNRSSGTNATFSTGAIVRIRRRDHRSMKTPTNGPSKVNGAIVTSVVTSSPRAVFCCSALNTTEAVIATRKIPSPPWPARRIQSNLR